MTAEGTKAILQWLEPKLLQPVPVEFLSGDNCTEQFEAFNIDPDATFNSRYEFGVYLNAAFSNANFDHLMSPECDGLWAWIAAIYFSQLTAMGVRRSEHYVVTRAAPKGSLAYRHSARTCYELVHVHGEGARLCLSKAMHTWGELSEQLTSRQSIAHNKGFFRTARELYIKNGGLRRGAATKPKKPRDRAPGDRAGLGGIRRLAIALQRLELTYDTDVMSPLLMTSVLPKEFAKWSVT